MKTHLVLRSLQVAGGTSIVKESLAMCKPCTVATTMLVDLHCYDGWPGMAVLQDCCTSVFGLESSVFSETKIKTMLSMKLFIRTMLSSKFEIMTQHVFIIDTFWLTDTYHWNILKSCPTHCLFQLRPNHFQDVTGVFQPTHLVRLGGPWPKAWPAAAAPGDSCVRELQIGGTCASWVPRLWWSHSKVEGFQARSPCSGIPSYSKTGKQFGCSGCLLQQVAWIRAVQDGCQSGDRTTQFSVQQWWRFCWGRIQVRVGVLPSNKIN